MTTTQRQNDANEVNASLNKCHCYQSSANFTLNIQHLWNVTIHRNSQTQWNSDVTTGRQFVSIT